MADVVAYIRDVLAPQALSLRDPFVGPATLTVTRIEGGTAVNIVPEACVIYIDRRIIPGETPEAVWAALKSSLEAGHSGKVEVLPPDLLDAALEGDATSGIAQALAASLVAVGLAPDAVGAPFGTDASKLGRAGIPTVVFGPGSIKDAHRPDESVDLGEVVAAVAAVTHLIRHFGAEGAAPGRSHSVRGPQAST